MKSCSLIFIFVIFMMSSCTHYRPLHYIGKGKPSKKAIRSCTDVFFGFPLNAERSSYQILTHEQGLVEKDVHSFDTSTSFILYPIYYQTCVLANLTQKGAKKVTKTEKLITREESTSSEVVDKKDVFYMYKSKKITKPRGCNKLPKYERGECKNALK